MKKNYSLIFGLIFLFFIFMIIFLGQYFPFVDKELTRTSMIKTDEGIMIPPFPPMKGYILGSDNNGVDVLSRLVIGAKETFLIVLTIVIIRYLIAIPLGVFSFYNKFIRYILTGVNQMFSFMPPIFFIALFIGIPVIVFSESRPIWMIVIIAFVEVGRVADSIFQNLEEISKKSFVEAGITTGCTKTTLFRKYYWPPLLPQILIHFTNDIGRVLFIIAQLGLVGIYITHEFVSQLGGSYLALNTSNAWPTMFSTLLHDIFGARWIPFATVGFIGFSLFTINLLVSGMKTYFDKKYRLYSE